MSPKLLVNNCLKALLPLLFLFATAQGAFAQSTENCFACRVNCMNALSSCESSVSYNYYRSINACYMEFNQQWYCCITNWIGYCCDAWMHPLDVWDDCMDDAYWEREIAMFSCYDEYYRCQSTCDAICDSYWEDIQ